MSSLGGDFAINNIGLVINRAKNGVEKIIKNSIKLLENKNISYLVEKKSAEKLNIKKNKIASYKELREQTDFIILFGGDGTFLHTAQHFISTDIPLLGVNMGSLGFMTEIEVHELEDAIDRIIKGDYNTEKRMMLETKIFRDDNEVFHSHSLNDIVVNRGANAHLIDIKLYVNDELVSSYNGDGLIISTPTGSTAYSLSAGGPIINPKTESILITPICPHSLYVRPMVVGAWEKVKVEVSSSKDKMKANADGRYDYDLHDGDILKINRSAREILMVKFPERTFYSTLREKMRVGLT